MQLINAMVAVGGDRNNIHFRQELTPIEIVLLQQLHGGDSVGSIEPVGDVERDPHEEMTRLRSIYPMQGEYITNLWRDWPGDRFPTKLSNLNISPSLLKPVEASKPYTVSAKSAAA
jgi:hypothetical protein